MPYNPNLLFKANGVAWDELYRDGPYIRAELTEYDFVANQVTDAIALPERCQIDVFMHFNEAVTGTSPVMLQVGFHELVPATNVWATPLYGNSQTIGAPDASLSISIALTGVGANKCAQWRVRGLSSGFDAESCIMLQGFGFFFTGTFTAGAATIRLRIRDLDAMLR
jgi:hypothetical protein